MTWLGQLIHVGDVVGPGGPYIGGPSWGGSRVSSRRSTLWPAWSQTAPSSGATSGAMARRRNAQEVREQTGRPNRARRQYLRRRNQAAHKRALERGRRFARLLP